MEIFVKMQFRHVILLFLILLIEGPFGLSASDIVKNECSFRTNHGPRKLVIEDDDKYRYMDFRLADTSELAKLFANRQSGIICNRSSVGENTGADLGCMMRPCGIDHTALAFEYAHSVLSIVGQALGKSIVSDPAALVIGAGAGSLSLALEGAFKSLLVHTVENDDLILRVANHNFGFRESSRQSIFLDDGRHFVSQLAKPASYDFIILDAFENAHNGEGILPPGMTTCQFFSSVRQALKPHGILLVNTLEVSLSYPWIPSAQFEFGDHVWKVHVDESQSLLVAANGGHLPNFFERGLHSQRLAPLEADAVVLTDEGATCEGGN